LFEKNFLLLLEKGIVMKDLLASSIFSYQFSFDDAEWPQTHTNCKKMIRPYNGSIFEIRRNYSEVFDELAKDLKHQVEARNDETH
jgi:hypothetical protein